MSKLEDWELILKYKGPVRAKYSMDLEVHRDRLEIKEAYAHTVYDMGKTVVDKILSHKDWEETNE